MAFQYPPSSVEPTARRIRVRLGQTLIADSSRAQLLIQIGPKRLPTYFLPLDDVEPGVLVDETNEGWSVAAGHRRVEKGAYKSTEFPELAGHVTFSWSELDWYEEDEQVFAHARPPNHRVDTLRSSRRVEVYVKGELIANSIRPVLLFETWLPTRYYLPYEDVRMDLLTASNTISYCPYKGRARYWSHPEVPDVAWSYPDPIPENPKIRELVSFYNEKVDMVIDGVPVERPDSPFV
jgi:uncharacterized protein (DUF427 family)